VSPVATKLVTADEFLRMPETGDGMMHELVRGAVVAVPMPGFRHGRRQLAIAKILDDYARPKSLGRAATEVGILIERGPDTVRGPDVSYWSAERLPLDQEPEGFVTIPPELCVEVLSPTNRRAELREKIVEYFRFGVRMVWVIDPEDRTLTVYRSADEARLFHENARFNGDDVLPCFECHVGDLFC
jgi:Uma2 family endonuclease